MAAFALCARVCACALLLCVCVCVCVCARICCRLCFLQIAVQLQHDPMFRDHRIGGKEEVLKFYHQLTDCTYHFFLRGGGCVCMRDCAHV